LRTRKAFYRPGETEHGEKAEKVAFIEPPSLLALARDIPRDVLAELVRDANESYRGINGGGGDDTPGLTLPGPFLSPQQQELVSHFLTQLADSRSGRGPDWAANVEACRTLAAHPERLQLDLWVSHCDTVQQLDTLMFLRLRAPGGDWAQDCRLANPLAVPADESEELLQARDLAPPAPHYLMPSNTRADWK
jgi:hypothetical protein